MELDSLIFTDPVVRKKFPASHLYLVPKTTLDMTVEVLWNEFQILEKLSKASPEIESAVSISRYPDSPRKLLNLANLYQVNNYLERLHALSIWMQLFIYKVGATCSIANYCSISSGRSFALSEEPVYYRY